MDDEIEREVKRHRMRARTAATAEQIAQTFYYAMPVKQKVLREETGGGIKAAKWTELSEAEREDWITSARRFLESLPYQGYQIVDKRKFEQAVLESSVGWEIGSY